MKGFYEFFAGGGMVRAALGSDWRCLLANDICARKGEVYAANWGSESLVVADIHQLALHDLPSHAALAWASFPCQDLSLAGNGAGLAGERSGAFWGFHKLMQGLANAGRKPRLIALENVTGAITSNDGQDFQALIQAIASLGYRVGALVMDAVHFLPQSRPRVLIVGLDADFDPPAELTTGTPVPGWHPRALIGAHRSWPAALREQWLWWNLPPPRLRVTPLEQLIELEPKDVPWHTAAETEKLLNMMSPANRRKVLAAQAGGQRRIGTLYQRTRAGQQRAEVRFDGISGCLRTPAGGSSRQKILVVQGSSIRSRLLSAREAARLMGLPDSYRLPARYNEAYHLAGDGVAVPVVAHLARHLLEPLMLLAPAASFDRLAA
ncbi:MAG: DNA cytosine methyltransferase [Pseudomonadota bacterium]